MSKKAPEQNPLFVFLTGTFVFITVFGLEYFPGSEGGFLVFWSLVVLGRFLSFIKSAQTKNTQKSRRPVHNILKGLSLKAHRNKDVFIELGLKTSIIVLGFFSMAFCGVLVTQSAGVPVNEMMGNVSVVLICGLIFWIIQAQSIDIANAQYFLGLLGVLFAAQLGFFEILPLSISLYDYQTAHLMGMCLFGGMGGYIFIRGLIYRHRHRLFPLFGVFVLCFILALTPYLSASAYISATALLAVCFVQSFKTSARYYNALGFRRELYS